MFVKDKCHYSAQIRIAIEFIRLVIIILSGYYYFKRIYGIYNFFIQTIRLIFYIIPMLYFMLNFVFLEFKDGSKGSSNSGTLV